MPASSIVPSFVVRCRAHRRTVFPPFLPLRCGAVIVVNISPLIRYFCSANRRTAKEEHVIAAMAAQLDELKASQATLVGELKVAVKVVLAALANGPKRAVRAAAKVLADLRMEFVKAATAPAAKAAMRAVTKALADLRMESVKEVLAPLADRLIADWSLTSI
jgi:hypothetical protein